MADCGAGRVIPRDFLALAALVACAAVLAVVLVAG